MSLKIFFGFIMDLYYFEWIGKYLTYVLGIGYLYPIILTIFATKIDSLLENVQVCQLTIYVFVLLIMMSMYKIVVSNWLSFYAKNHNLPKVHSSIKIGKAVGELIGSSAFLYFYSSENPVITPKMFILIMAAHVIITTLVIHTLFY